MPNALLGTGTTSIKGQTCSLTSRSIRVVSMTGDRKRITNFNGDKCTRLLSKISPEDKVLYWKIIGKFVGQHVLLVIESEVKIGVWNPVLVVHSEQESISEAQPSCQDRSWITLWWVLHGELVLPKVANRGTHWARFNKWIRAHAPCEFFRTKLSTSAAMCPFFLIN